tara:strand:+ start:133 stop:1650 length:1518 start_codon:yes stop_codon:yes gene_type:complete
MNPNAILKFLQSLRNLAKSGAVKSVDQAMDFAKREFGEVTDLFKRQIEQVFRKPEGGITSIKKPKEGEVIEASFKPGVDKRGKRVEESPSQASGVMQRLEKQKDDLFNMLKDNPYRSGGPLDPKMGLVRTAARQVLQKLAREGKINISDEREAKAIIEGYQGGVDPIEVFKKTFGQDVLNDLSNLGDELIEIENKGGSFKEIVKILDNEGFFNLKQPENPPQGMTPDELDELKKEIENENTLKDFDPEDREPNSMGGINRVNFRDAGKVLKLASFFKSKGTTLVDEIRKAVDNIFASGDSKYDADVAVDSALEEFGVDREMFDQRDIIDAYGIAYDTVTKQRGLGGKVPGDRSFKGVEIKDPKFDENMPFDNDAEKLAEIKMSNEAYEDFDLEKGLDDLDNFRVTKDAAAAKKAIDAERAKELAPKMVERLELKQKYPGIDDDLLDNIIADSDPQHKAQVLATLDQTFKLMETGKGPDEIIDILEQGKKTRKDNAQGGLNYLMGL